MFLSLEMEEIRKTKFFLITMLTLLLILFENHYCIPLPPWILVMARAASSQLRRAFVAAFTEVAEQAEDGVVDFLIAGPDDHDPRHALGVVLANRFMSDITKVYGTERPERRRYDNGPFQFTTERVRAAYRKFFDGLLDYIRSAITGVLNDGAGNTARAISYLAHVHGNLIDWTNPDNPLLTRESIIGFSRLISVACRRLYEVCVLMIHQAGNAHMDREDAREHTDRQHYRLELKGAIDEAVAASRLLFNPRNSSERIPYAQLSPAAWGDQTTFRRAARDLNPGTIAGDSYDSASRMIRREVELPARGAGL